MNIFMQYDWHGNVRELENVIERAVVLGTHETILPQDLPPQMQTQELKETCSDAETLAHTIKKAEKERIEDALKLTNWHKTKTARILGISRKTLWEKIKTYNIRKE